MDGPSATLSTEWNVRRSHRRVAISVGGYSIWVLLMLVGIPSYFGWSAESFGIALIFVLALLPIYVYSSYCTWAGDRDEEPLPRGPLEGH